MGTSKNFVLWLLGPTSSGKTTIANQLVFELRKRDITIISFDGDEVRNFFGKNFGFTSENRIAVVKTLTQLANKSIDAGINVIVSALTANKDARNYVKNNCKNLILGYVQCSIEVCAARDPKGLYARAQKGEINTLIGYNSEYIPPTAEITINTEKKSLYQSTEFLIDELKNRKILIN